ncbi:MAG: hypothetical protein ACI8RD_001041 [Bacillariaceae sp.]|jgi:hypothetical protein
MGSRWSKNSSSLDVDESEEPTSTSVSTSKTANQPTPLSLSFSSPSVLSSSDSDSRKRRRNGINDDNDVEDKNNDDSGSGREETEKEKESASQSQRPRKRRRVTPSFGITDTCLLWFTKFALLMIESIGRLDSLYHVNRPEVEKKETMDFLMRMLQYFQLRDINVLRRGWGAISLLTTEDANIRPVDQQRSIRESNLEEDIALITTVMRSHSKCEEIQYLGFRAMEYLVMSVDNDNDDDSSNNNNIDTEIDWGTLVKGGAISAFVDILRNFQNRKDMTTCCFMFLFMLIKEGEDVNSRRIFIELGGIPLILQSIIHYVDNTDLTHTGCALIHYLTTFETSRNDLINHNVIDCLVVVMDKRSSNNNTEIINMCLVSLRQISVDNDLPAGRHEFIPILIQLMKYHPNDEGVQFYSLILIRTAGRTETIHHQLAVPTIVAAMRRFPDHDGIVFFGSLLFWRILSNDNANTNEALTFISSEGGIESVIAATIANNGNLVGLATVAHAILIYAWENRPPEQEPAVVAFGGSRQIISLITKFNQRNDDNDNDNDNNGGGGPLHIAV